MPLMRVFIGIDPGLDGAVAAVSGRGTLLGVYDAPSLLVSSARKKKRMYVDAEMAKIIRTIVHRAYGYSSVVFQVYLENVHAMPHQGVSSMFNMGVGLGLWRGIVAAFDLPVHFVAPPVWKKALGISPRQDKAASIVRARQLYPKASLYRKKDHGRADALLIAEYARQRCMQDLAKKEGNA